MEITWGHRALSKVSTGHSDIPSCCERKHGLPFESQQGKQAFLRVRGTQCPFKLMHQTQGLSYIPIPERSLLLRCLWKVGIPLESKPVNQKRLFPWQRLDWNSEFHVAILREV